jgi:hypothetical protein
MSDLVSTRIVSGWKVYKCCNCNIDVCALDINNPTHALVNMDLEERGENGPHALPKDGKRFYSNCFRIILEDSGNLEETGISRDLHAIDTFNKLQRQVDNFISAEERMMEKRIRTFIKEQQEAFNLVKSRANKDRAILWRTLCRMNSTFGGPVSHPQPIPSSTLSTSASSSSSIKIASSAPSYTTPVANTIPSVAVSPQPAEKAGAKLPQVTVATDKGWRAAERGTTRSIPLTTSSTDGDIFSFDDDQEDGEPYTPQLLQFNTQRTQQSDPLSDDEDVDMSSSDSAKYLATSLPVHILNPLLATGGRTNANTNAHTNTTNTTTTRRAHSRTVGSHAPPPVAVEVDIARGQVAPRESWSSRSEIGTDMPAELAASFAVPLSLNRRIKSLI